MTLVETIKKGGKTSKWVGILLLIAGFLSLIAPLGAGLSITVMLGALLLFSGVGHLPATEETRPEMFDAYKSTYELYKEVYGRPNPRYWPAPGTRMKRGRKLAGPIATCGDSYSGFVANIVKSYKGKDPLYTL